MDRILSTLLIIILLVSTGCASKGRSISSLDVAKDGSSNSFKMREAFLQESGK